MLAGGKRGLFFECTYVDTGNSNDAVFYVRILYFLPLPIYMKAPQPLNVFFMALHHGYSEVPCWKM